MALTFHLNPNAKWHDGQPVTPDDVVFTIDFFKKNPYHWITVDDVNRELAQETHTVDIYLSKPYSPLLSDIGWTMPMIPKHIFDRGGESPGAVP